MKKTLFLLIALILVSSLAACASAPAESQQPDMTETVAVTPELTPTEEPTPEVTPEPEPTPIPLTSRAALLNIGFEQVTEDIYACQSQKLFGQPFMALLANEGTVDNPYEGFLIDYSKGKVTVGFAYEEKSSDKLIEIQKEIDAKYQEWGEPADEELTAEQDAEIQALYDQLFAERAVNGYTLASIIDKKTGEFYSPNDMRLNMTALECINISLDFRSWDVFLLEKQDELGYSFKQISSDDTIVDGYAILTDMQQDGYASPQELRDRFGMAELDVNLEQQIVNEAYAQYEKAKMIIEETLGVSVAELLSLQ